MDLKSTMLNILYVGLGGFLGAAGRYLISLAWQGRGPEFPMATLIANLVGCFLIGGIAYFVLRGGLHPGYHLFFVVGVLGGFTTFSSFSLETLGLVERGRFNLALLYVGLSLIGGVVLTWLGAGTARWMLTRS